MLTPLRIRRAGYQLAGESVPVDRLDPDALARFRPEATT